LRLLLIGQGPELAKLRQFIDSRPRLSPQVHLLGSSNRVPELLNAMDAYVLCSLTEGISNSLLEAMATGLAVAATAVGGSPEVVVNGDSGLLFPVGDVRQLANILMLLQSRKDLRAKLGQEAMRRVGQHFSLCSMVRRYEEVYQDVARVSSMRLAAAYQ
ncbi:MAG: glycosyltransferase, partial [Gemmataceae bacterium]